MFRVRRAARARRGLARRLQPVRRVSVPTAPKVLVVYFSRTGTTRHLAESIARATHGEVEELRERRSRRGPLGWLRSGYEGTYRRSAETLLREPPLATLPMLERDVKRSPAVWVGETVEAAFGALDRERPAGARPSAV